MNSKQKQTIIKLLKSNRDNKDYSERYWFPYDTFLDVTDAFTAFSCERLDGKQDYIAMINRLQNADDAAKAFVDHVQIPVFAVSLGAVESILSYPTTMSHAAMSKEEREKRGITDGLLRFSAGLEFTDDLIADFDQALHAAEVYAAVKTSAS